MHIAIQGIKGSFHDQAATEFLSNSGLPTNYTPLECASFQQVFKAVADNQVDYGVVAVENSVFGSINPVYKLLAGRQAYICGEVRLHVVMNLIGINQADKNSTLELPEILSQYNKPDIEVISHPVALGQCQNWLDTNLPLTKHTETSDTAEALRDIVKKQSTSQLTIASDTAQSLYGGQILVRQINDDPANYTRFFIICSKPTTIPEANRTSIIITEKDGDSSGSLYQALGAFAKRQINLSKLDSHTLPGKQRKYSFYIDFDESANSPVAKQALAELSSSGWDVNLLGSYQKQD